MAKLKQIKGTRIQFRNTDPQLYAGSWSSGGTLNSTAHAQSGGSGTSTAALIFGGEGPPGISPRYITLTEEYNGSAFTEKNDLNTARTMMGGAGTTTASIGTGGTSPPSPNSALNESWNGTCWTEVMLYHLIQQHTNNGMERVGQNKMI